MKVLELDVPLWTEHRRSGPVFRAQGLQYDLKAEGLTLPVVQQSIARQIVRQVEFDQMLGKAPFWDTAPAKPCYWHALRTIQLRWNLQIEPPDDSSGMETWQTEAG